MIERYFPTLGSYDTLLAMVPYHVLQIFLDLQDSPISGSVSCCHPSAAAVNSTEHCFNVSRGALLEDGTGRLLPCCFVPRAAYSGGQVPPWILAPKFATTGVAGFPKPSRVLGGRGEGSL